MSDILADIEAAFRSSDAAAKNLMLRRAHLEIERIRTVRPEAAVRDLVDRFAIALADKLIASEQKHGWQNAWLRDDWETECRAELMRHIGKGDPRDVAAYCAFLWHHGWSAADPADPACPDCGGDHNRDHHHAQCSRNGIPSDLPTEARDPRTIPLHAPTTEA